MLNQKTWEALWLGIVQGITEFLPISSDGHLAVVHALMKSGKTESSGEDPVELFMVLHLGTLLSILVVYRRQIFDLVKQPRLCGLIVLATIPVVIVGLFFKDFFDSALQNPLIAGIGFLITAGFLIAAERLETQRIPLEQLNWRQALAIGTFQTLAPLPGVSRSGTTISTALMLGLQRNAATTFSFLLAIPAIGGACALMLKDLLKDVLSGQSRSNEILPLAVGGVTSFVVGWLCLQWLIRIVARGKLRWFAAYLLVIGAATVIWQLVAPTPHA